MSIDEARKYVERWKLGGPLLDEFHREELRQFDHARHAKAIDDLLALGLMHASARPLTGMVEMQRILARARR